MSVNVLPDGNYVTESSAGPVLNYLTEAVLDIKQKMCSVLEKYRLQTCKPFWLLAGRNIQGERGGHRGDKINND